MNVARGGSGIAVIGNKIYMIGGCDKINTSHSSVECYDISLDVWQRCASMNKKRYGAGVSLFFVLYFNSKITLIIFFVRFSGWSR